MGASFLDSGGFFAAAGCATGFLWSVLAGDAKLSTAKGWARATLGCAGSAVNGLGIYTLTDHFTHDQDLARNLTLGWFGAQSAAGFTNWLGRRNHWEDRPAYNAVSIPLNFAASPVISSVGLLWAGVGEAAVGFHGEVHAFGGMLVFDHRLCIQDAMNLGATGHCFSSKYLQTSLHEMGHQVQVSILGDLGTLGTFAGDILFRTFTLRWKTLGQSPGLLTLEPWADDYSEVNPKK